MAQNYLHEGCTLKLTNGSGAAIASGEPIFVGGIKGVALADIANNATGPVHTEGVFTLTKKASLAISEGDSLFWDVDPGEITKTAADGVFIGVAAAAAGSSDATVNVLLVQGAGVPAAYVAAISTADGSDAATTQALANATKTKVNAILTALQAKGIMLSA